MTLSKGHVALPLSQDFFPIPFNSFLVSTVRRQKEESLMFRPGPGEESGGRGLLLPCPPGQGARPQGHQAGRGAAAALGFLLNIRAYYFVQPKNMKE